MKNWKKLCALGIGLSLILSTAVFAEEMDFDPASIHGQVTGEEVEGFVGGIGPVEGIAEDAQPEEIVSQFEVVEPADDGDYDIIEFADEIQVKVPASYNSFWGIGGHYYICPYENYEIPYAMVGMHACNEDFSFVLRKEVQRFNKDAQILEDVTDVQVGKYQMKKVVYSFTLDGYPITDTRLFMEVDDMYLVFGAKECPALNLTVGSIVEEMIDNLTIDQAVSQTGTGPLPGASQTETIPVPQSTPALQNTEYGFDLAFDESWANYTGVWVNFDDSYQIYLPAHWIYYNLTEEEKAQKIYYHCGNNGGDIIAGSTDLHVTVNKGTMGQSVNMADVAKSLADAGYGNAMLGLINGMEAVAYDIAEQNLVGFLFRSPNEPGVIITLEGYYYGEASDSALQMLQSAVCSVSPMV